MTWLTAHPDQAAMCGNDPGYERQAEAGAAGTAADERLEDAVADRRRQPRAIVGDLEADVAVVRRQRPQGNSAARRQRLEGVDDEVEHDLVELLAIAAGERPGGEVARHLD